MHCIKRSRTSFNNNVKYYVDDAKIQCKISDDGKIQIDDTVLSEIHLAAKYNNITLLKQLLDSGVDVNIKGPFGLTPLSLAAYCNKFNAVQLLLQRNADVAVFDFWNRMALDVLLSKSSLLPENVEKTLLNIMINNETNPVRQAEILVRSNCHLKLVLYLKNPRTTVEYLYRKLLNIKEDSYDAIKFAMERFDLENLKVLLQFGVGVNVRRTLFFQRLMTMLMPVRRRNLEHAKVFLTRLVPWDLILEETLDYFYKMFAVGDFDLVDLLLRTHIVEQINKKFNMNLLAHVFENRNVNANELLKRWKFNVNVKGKNDWTALHFAVRGNSKENVQLLLDLGVDINAKNQQGRTPLVEAVAEDLTQIVEILLAHGADIQTSFGHSENLEASIEKEAIPFGNNVSPGIQQCLIAQMIINESTRKQKIEDSVRNQIRLHEKCEEFYNNWCQYIEEMKEDYILASLTLFDAITEDVNEIAKHVWDEESFDLVEDGCLKRGLHPYFIYIVMSKLKKIRRSYQQKVHFTMVTSDIKGMPVDLDELAKNDVSRVSIRAGVNVF